MKEILDAPYSVVYYEGDVRMIYWPADERSSVVAQKLREARAAGIEGARIAQVA